MMDALPLFDARRAGLKEGRAEGRIEGLAEGARNAKFETARNFFKKNISAEIIAECTGLPLEEVNKLNQNNS